MSDNIPIMPPKSSRKVIINIIKRERGKPIIDDKKEPSDDDLTIMEKENIRRFMFKNKPFGGW